MRLGSAQEAALPGPSLKGGLSLRTREAWLSFLFIWKMFTFLYIFKGRAGKPRHSLMVGPRQHWVQALGHLERGRGFEAKMRNPGQGFNL